MKIATPSPPATPCAPRRVDTRRDAHSENAALPPLISTTAVMTPSASVKTRM